MLAPPGIERELVAIGRLSRELEEVLTSLREQTAAYLRDRQGPEAAELAAIWRNTAAQHVRCRPVLRNLLR